MVPRSVLTFIFTVGVAYAAGGGARLSGGSDTDIETYPMAVQVESFKDNFWTHSCAGTILTSRYILSAAQCFSGVEFSHLLSRIRYGSGERGTGGETSSIEYVTTHPNFNENSLDYDITLVRLTTTLSYTDQIQPGTIIASGYLLPADMPVTMIGWGDSDDDDSDEAEAKVLQELTSKIIDLEDCAVLLKVNDDSSSETDTSKGSLEVTKNMLCMSDLETKGAGACKGDVGGPVIYSQAIDDVTTNMIVGIISWPNGCNDSVRPTVATAVSVFTDWIVANAV